MNAPTDGGLALAEYLTPSDQVLHQFERVLVRRQTRFQRLEICHSDTHGTVLLLDGTWQSCTADEFIYHEALVLPALLECAAPRRVLILGGGEGATAREALRFAGVERVVMVDIDGEVVEACRRHLPEMHAGCFDDPRLELVVGDALDVLDTTAERFDVVISDLSDPIENGPSFRLFTREYFDKTRRVLAPDGAFVVQAGSVAPSELRTHARLHKTVATAFGHAATYRAFVPSFGTPWGFILARNVPIAPPDPAQIDARVERDLAGRCRWLDGASLLGARSLPPYVAEALDDPSIEPFCLADPPKYG